MQCGVCMQYLLFAVVTVTVTVTVTQPPWCVLLTCQSCRESSVRSHAGRPAGEVWAANEAHAVHRNNDPGLVWHWAAADSRWWLLRSRMDPSASPY